MGYNMNVNYSNTLIIGGTALISGILVFFGYNQIYSNKIEKSENVDDIVSNLPNSFNVNKTLSKHKQNLELKELKEVKEEIKQVKEIDLKEELKLKLKEELKRELKPEQEHKVSIPDVKVSIPDVTIPDTKVSIPDIKVSIPDITIPDVKDIQKP